MKTTIAKKKAIQSNFSKNLFYKNALIIVETLSKLNHTVYFAGGCVRDAYLNRPFNDIDIATSATPEEVRKTFPASKKIGAHFGVILVYINNQAFEVATFRKDGLYKDGRHPEEVSFASDQVDAQRRDFTINGLFYNPLTSEIIDYVNGVDDLKNKVIACIGDPQKRFQEDHLRILRCIRFFSQLSDHQFQIAPLTLKTISSHGHLIDTISKERIREEVIKIFSSLKDLAPILLIEKYSLSKYIFKIDYNVKNHDLLKNIVLHQWAQAMTPVFALFWDQASNFSVLQKQLVLTNKETMFFDSLQKNLKDLPQVKTYPLWQLKRFIRNPYFEETLLFLKYWTKIFQPSLLENITYLNEKKRQYFKELAPSLFINGNDLIEEGLSPSPFFKEILSKLENAQLDNTITSKKEALIMLKKLLRTDYAKKI